ncbi:MAG TPA: C1 family peptidase [Bacteroidales bacterium]|jgi:bleomycin hydrolase|nr:aminopeptidase [Bacteroidales bacterium]HOF16037.1 C1 family peptidase [Bacteroidales bacterium]HON21221.1 C1 family peptidase [Bacteroidales bacterium]HOR82002.1 C1 family peptidase [Bacteroidales bacterium]HPJ91278.1 C1 family peptidase [Bacteroidales bacterium]
MKKISVFLAVAFLLSQFNLQAQNKDTTEKEGYIFTDVKRLPATSVKSQDRAGTCWSWSTISFFESEMMRLKKDSVSLAPLYIVWNTYNEKAIRYVRMHGSLNFAQGGSFADVVWAIKNYGIVPLSVYSGLNYGDSIHAHGELDAVLKSYVDAIIKNPNRKLSTAWLRGYNAVLNEYLGAKPEKFSYNGKEYTPESFYKNATGLNMDDYVSLTSFTHHPFYTAFPIEVPDNWIGEMSYNIPMDELMDIMDKAIDNGYTFAWGADVSEEGFVRRGSIAIVPDYTKVEMADAEIAKWTTLPKQQKMAEFLKNPGKEKEITQEMRQVAFDNYETTDDHGMHVIGKATDQNGNKFFIVKNSWGEYGDYKGFLYASYNYAAYKTLNILIHKDALPKELKKKLKL